MFKNFKKGLLKKEDEKLLTTAEHTTQIDSLNEVVVVVIKIKGKKK